MAANIDSFWQNLDWRKGYSIENLNRLDMLCVKEEGHSRAMMRQEKCWRERRKLNQNLTCFPWGGVNGETQTLAGRVSCRQKWIWTTFLLMDGLPNLITFLLLHSENRGYQWKQKIMSGFWEWGEWYQFYERDREESVREKGHSSFLKMF